MSLTSEQQRTLDELRARAHNASEQDDPAPETDAEELLASLAAGWRRPGDLVQEELTLVTETYGTARVLAAIRSGRRRQTPEHELEPALHDERRPESQPGLQLQSGPQRDSAPEPLPRPQPAPDGYGVYVWLSAAASVALVTAAVYWTYHPMPPVPPVANPPGVEKPAPGAAASLPAPRFLATRLELPSTRGLGVPFRGSTPRERHIPQREGRIVAVDRDGQLRIDLGAGDGLATGQRVVILAEPDSNLPEVQATVVSTLYNRASIDPGPQSGVGAGRRIRQSASTHLRALSRQIDAALAIEDMETVREAAERASDAARAGEASADVRRLVLRQLAVLAKDRGDLATTDTYLSEALTLLDAPQPASPLERSELLNAMGRMLAARDRRDDARKMFERALESAPKDGPIAAEVLNNLGALAALRGERTEAEARYRDALSRLSWETEKTRRAVVEKNLAQLQSTP